MKQVKTKAIVLARTNYQEADRILTLLTPDQGKIRGLARGVRKERSKLAAGIELFSESEISYIVGRGEIMTLTSTRLIKHYDHIVSNMDRTMLGYEFLKRINRITEEGAEAEYFDLLLNALKALDQLDFDKGLLELWFNAQLLKLGGHQPNLATDSAGNKLAGKSTYMLDVEDMVFSLHAEGFYNANHIKLLRLVFAAKEPTPLTKLQNIEKVLLPSQNLVSSMLRQYVRI